MMVVMLLCVALLPTFFQTNNARFSGLLCVGNESESESESEIMGPVREKTQVLVVTTRRFRSSAVLIMSQENHSTIRTLLSKRCQTEVTSSQGSGLLLLRVVSPFRNPHHPKVSSP